MKPMHFAVASGCPGTCRIFLESDAVADATDDDGWVA